MSLDASGVQAFQRLPTILQSAILLEISVECSRTDRARWEESRLLRAGKVLSRPVTPTEVERVALLFPMTGYFTFGGKPEEPFFVARILQSSTSERPALTMRRAFISTFDQVVVESWRDDVTIVVDESLGRKMFLDTRAELSYLIQRCHTYDIPERMAHEEAQRRALTCVRDDPVERFIRAYVECVVRGYDVEHYMDELLKQNTVTLVRQERPLYNKLNEVHRWNRYHNQPRTNQPRTCRAVRLLQKLTEASDVLEALIK